MNDIVTNSILFPFGGIATLIAGYTMRVAKSGQLLILAGVMLLSGSLAYYILRTAG